jgi:hypothetical protein
MSMENDGTGRTGRGGQAGDSAAASLASALGGHRSGAATMERWCVVKQTKTER